LGGIGIIIGFGLVIYQQIQNENDRNRTIGHIDDMNQRYQWNLESFEAQLNIEFKVPRTTVQLGRKTYVWAAREVLGPDVLKYLKWRIEHPEYVSPSPQEVVSKIGDAFRKYLSPGALLIQDKFPQSWTAEQFRIGYNILKLPNMLNTDHHEYLANFAAIQKHLAEQNGNDYKMQIMKIYTHKKAAQKRELIHKTEQNIAFSDVVATQIIEAHVEKGSDFQVYQTSAEAFDAIATMELPRYEIESHLDSLMQMINTCIGDFVPLPVLATQPLPVLETYEIS
jgi:hypothetical protein